MKYLYLHHQETSSCWNPLVLINRKLFSQVVPVGQGLRRKTKSIPLLEFSSVHWAGVLASHGLLSVLLNSQQQEKCLTFSGQVKETFQQLRAQAEMSW